MKLKKIKDVLGKEAEGMTDEELLELDSTAEMFANMAIDQWQKMSPEERKKWAKKGNRIKE